MQRQLLGVDLDMRAVRFPDQRVNLVNRKGDDEGVQEQYCTDHPQERTLPFNINSVDVDPITAIDVVLILAHGKVVEHSD